MRKPKFYIITEDHKDAKIIKSLLKGVDNYQILYADGFSSMLSKASTILNTQESHVIIFADTDSVDYHENKAKDSFIREILNYSQYKNRLKIILAAPELEVALFNNKEFFEHYFHTNISQVQWEQMRHAPKQYLHYFFNSNSDSLYDNILSDPEWQEELLNSSIRKELIRYYHEQTSS